VAPQETDLGKSASLLRGRNTLPVMLSSSDKAILDFERVWWQQPGGKDKAIEFTLGLTSAAYYERLRRLIVRTSALAYDPLTVKRVRGIVDIPVEREVAI
jgi:hypothetical protein